MKLILLVFRYAFGGQEKIFYSRALYLTRKISGKFLLFFAAFVRWRESGSFGYLAYTKNYFTAGQFFSCRN
jgi:hypothetical protein